MVLFTGGYYLIQRHKQSQYFNLQINKLSKTNKKLSELKVIATHNMNDTEKDKFQKDKDILELEYLSLISQNILEIKKERKNKTDTIRIIF